MPEAEVDGKYSSQHKMLKAEKNTVNIVELKLIHRKEYFMFRIFLTGDNHIGRKYASHEKSKELAEARIDAFSNMIKCANDENCDLFCDCRRFI